MRASIRFLHSPDVPDLKSYTPDDPSDVGVFVQIFAGPADGPGEESFDLMICTPTWLGRRLRHHDGYEFGRHYLFIDRWDYRLVEASLSRIVDNAEGTDWTQVAEKIGRFAKWEFEDYVDDGQR